MRCALLGPIPGSLPSSSMRSWTGPSNTQSSAAHATGQRAQLLLRQGGDLLGGVSKRADEQVLQGLDVVGVDDLGIDLHRVHLSVALEGGRAQTAAGLA